MFLFGSTRAPRAYVFALHNSHFKAMNHISGILETLMRKHIGTFHIELVIVQEAAEEDELISATSALSLAKMLKHVNSYRTTPADKGTTMALVAYEVGRAETYACKDDAIIILHDSTTPDNTIDFLSELAVSGRKVNVINIRDYLECMPSTPKKRVASSINHARVER
jgi:hypothetical protein